MSVISSWLGCSSLIAKEEVWTGSKVLLDGDCLQARTASFRSCDVAESHCSVRKDRTQTLGSRGAVSLTHVLVWPVLWGQQVCADGSLWKPIEWSAAIACSAVEPEPVMFSSVFFSGASLYVLRIFRDVRCINPTTWSKDNGIIGVTVSSCCLQHDVE